MSAWIRESLRIVSSQIKEYWVGRILRHLHLLARHLDGPVLCATSNWFSLRLGVIKDDVGIWRRAHAKPNQKVLFDRDLAMSEPIRPILVCR